MAEERCTAGRTDDRLKKLRSALDRHITGKSTDLVDRDQYALAMQKPAVSRATHLESRPLDSLAPIPPELDGSSPPTTIWKRNPPLWPETRSEACWGQ